MFNPLKQKILDVVDILKRNDYLVCEVSVGQGKLIKFVFSGVYPFNKIENYPEWFEMDYYFDNETFEVVETELLYAEWYMKKNPKTLEEIVDDIREWVLTFCKA